MHHWSCWCKGEWQAEETQLQSLLIINTEAQNNEIAADQALEQETIAAIEQETQRQARLEVEYSELEVESRL